MVDRDPRRWEDEDALLRELRSAYREITPPAALLERAQLRAWGKAERSRPWLRRIPATGRPRLLLAALTLSAAAVAVGIGGGGVRRATLESTPAPTPTSPVASPPSARPPGVSLPSPVASPSNARPDPRAPLTQRARRSTTDEGTNGDVVEEPAPTRGPGGSAGRFSTVPERLASSKAGHPRLSGDPGNAREARFFELDAPRRSSHDTEPGSCLGTFESDAPFPQLGFSAQPVVETLPGNYSCAVRWDLSSDEARSWVDGADWLHLSIEPTADALVSCSTRRGIRVPVRTTLEVAGALMQADGHVLLQDPDHFSFSVRARSSRPPPPQVDNETDLARGRRSLSLSLMGVGGPIVELREHGVLRTAVSFKAGARPRARGQLTCRKSQ